MAVLPPQSGSKDEFQILNNDEQKLYWADQEIVKGNIRNPQISGECRGAWKKIYFQFKAQNQSFTKIYETDCVGGYFVLQIPNSDKLPGNDLYEVEINGVVPGIGNREDVSISVGQKSYDLFLIDLQNEFVITNPSSNPHGTESPNLTIQGLCSQNPKVKYSVRWTRNNSIEHVLICHPSTAWTLDPVILDKKGTHTFLFQLQDEYNNQADVYLYVTYGVGIVVSGMPSAFEFDDPQLLDNCHLFSNNPAHAKRACLEMVSATPLSVPDGDVVRDVEAPFMSYDDDAKAPTAAWVQAGVLGRLFNVFSKD